MDYKWYQFDPKKDFFNLKIVQVCSFGLVISSVLVCGTILYQENLSWDFSSEGFNNILSIFKVPLGILALSIPIIALLATNHRSVQSVEQIKVAEAQNNFSNSFKHLEEFNKYMEDVIKCNWLTTVKDNFAIHRKLFPNVRNGDYRIDDDIKNKLINIYDDLVEIFESPEKFSFSKEMIWNVYEKNCQVACLLEIRWDSSEWLKSIDEGKLIGKFFYTNDSGMQEISIVRRGDLWLMDILHNTQKVIQILEFDWDFHPSDSMEKFLILNHHVGQDIWLDAPEPTVIKRTSFFNSIDGSL